MHERQGISGRFVIWFAIPRRGMDEIRNNEYGRLKNEEWIIRRPPFNPHWPCRGGDSQARRCTCARNRLPLKWYAPIASAAALVVQGRRAREKCSGAQRAPCRLAMVAAQIQRRKASRFVIARPRRGRGNLGEAVTILSELACYPPGSCEISTSLRSSE